ncbi:hypothetical protein [Campylobacter insulaenigrae]|uniref:hypothetical protein n=1 Tax=Campylobacter insulaenigrae TaxID=260714 RepID=UPI002152FDAF|nr:hypothetical protein [Campylobacter insulaenigrae]MCR6576888.1 hypothetical protein [Campylobacter insulaenigrae]
MKLKLNLENCYGIGKLNEEFDFSEENFYLFYAQNGIFKTSFNKTLKNLIKKEAIKDEFFSHRQSKAEVKFNETELNSENTLVFDSYNEKMSAEKSVSTFIASASLKDEYDSIVKNLEKKKKDLIATIKKDTGSSDCEKEILQIFPNQNFYEIVDSHFDEIEKIQEVYTFKYHDIFDDKGYVKNFLKENKELLNDYFARYTELLSQSEIFKNTDNGSFGTHQSKELQNALKNEQFFKANHKLIIANQTIETIEQLQEIFSQELDRLLSDKDLREKFDAIEKKIKNKELLAFKEAINQNNDLLLKLNDYENFKKQVIFSYLYQNLQQVKELREEYHQQKEHIREIINKARGEQEKWKSIIDTFNSRFFVPFKVEIKNQENVVLSREKVAQFDFKFQDYEETNTTKDILQECLSTGEKRALYILQILFEIEVRKMSEEPTLLVFDDIADSFDYRNKYAIIEYLYDLKEYNNFKLIVMTHNFDFYRTLASRLGINRKYIKIIRKNDNREIFFENGAYLKTFITIIANSQNDKDLITLIPFTRNIIEYTRGTEYDSYKTLTQCLHIKQETKEITVGKILEIFKSIFGKEYQYSNREQKILDFIYQVADEICNAGKKDFINLQNKIALSIAIRLKAEEFMFAKLQDKNIEFKSNQTRELFNKIEQSLSIDEKSLMQKVLMITSENIHINSFMYEPILDTSLQHLFKCYEEIKKMKF